MVINCFMYIYLLHLLYVVHQHKNCINYMSSFCNNVVIYAINDMLQLTFLSNYCSFVVVATLGTVSNTLHLLLL